MVPLIAAKDKMPVVIKEDGKNDGKRRSEQEERT